MRRRSSGQSSPPDSSSEQRLHPLLQKALGNLDVQLEEELARYRRQRLGRSQPTGQRRIAVQSQPALNTEFMSVAASGLPQARSEQVTPAAPGADDRDRLWDSASPAAARLAIAPNLAATGIDATSHAAAAADLIALDPDADAAQKPAHPDADMLGPDDYLQSSEDLLRSLAEEEAKVRAEQGPGLFESLLTPLGVGSMLLLLLSSATLGYLILNPGTFTAFRQGQPTSSGGAVTDTANSTETPSANLAAIPDSPNLATEEFIDLNLNTLSIIPGSTLASPAAEQSTASETTAPSTTLPDPQVSQPAAAPVQPSQPYVAAAPSAPAPAPAARPAPVQAAAPAPVQAPAPAPAPAAVSSAPAPSNYYYVVTEYSGDGSLNQARQAVGDAYVRNFPNGARVQMGAFSDQEGAQELIQDLQQQGISAQVYQR